MKSFIINLAALISVAALAPAQSTTWYYGQSDNSANYSVAADSSQAIDWMDGWAGGAQKDLSRFGSEGLQVNRPGFFDGNQSIMMFGFGGISVASADVTLATLYLRQDFSFPTGVQNTWNIVGIASGNDNWDTGSMNWNDINTGTLADWTGGDLLGSLTGSYGTFQDLGTSTDSNLAINITAALQDYLNGSISGIAFVNSAPGGNFSADNSFVAFSDDNTTATNRPGLLVTAIPEPSAAALAALGLLGIITRRRR